MPKGSEADALLCSLSEYHRYSTMITNTSTSSMTSLIALTLMVILSLMAVSTTHSYAFNSNFNQHERILVGRSRSSSSFSRYNSCVIVPQQQTTTPTSTTSCPAATTALCSVHNNDDNKDESHHDATDSKRSRLRRTLCFWNNSSNNRMTTPPQQQKSNQTARSRSKSKTKRRAATIVAASLASAGGIVSILGGGTIIVPAPSYALTQADIAEQGLQHLFFTTGYLHRTSRTIGEGEMPDEIRDNIDAKSSVGSITGLSKEDAIQKTKKSDLYGEYDAELDDDDTYGADFDEADEEYLFGTGNSDSGTAVDVRKQRASSFSASSSKSGSSASTDVSNKISKGTKDSFSGGGKTKPIKIYVSVAVACFIPTFGLFGVRDYIRNRKEENNVIKGLEITEAQRAEYFGLDKNGKNITDTTNSTDTNNSDGSGSGSGGDSSGSGSSSGGGYDNDNGGEDGPSDDDIQRLGDIFNKS
ncbi:hypothetical protein FRACYDRAFT_262942 [Fragilariopsis cylindrus CCMP1102]|uniref:Uncharacterized protein n=1 Tax=Fragilariopsis cylindrus CCMP1102 TaxID=635003 RepID=A0A1E7F2T3_9STRA|nr:hypothetical protein FRACYDRAFT_262942 [Fragilariopsis cylindrus CCMP1102]|eukprot:OEU12447.1 hypothetical protein FRACYDRAFT_262942 [Fragilariopsis cylindrus CCMP1102]